ncbi:MAG: hypothetical protein A2Y02_01135 [Omnitrophica bacterium GWA2_52_12]|nr:MAG: hypothetical protein A2Y02_01135 [Omnitrophica bacterium GWA2_52_12]
MLKLRPPGGLFAALLFAFFLPLLHAAPPEATVISAEDASDRAYLERVLTLIQDARKSVDMAMFAIQYPPDPKEPANRLMRALAAAAQSGIRVRLWLNTRQAAIGTDRIFMRPDLQQELLRQGIRIFAVNKDRRLHDKLIVIDGNIVVEGSMNWTREALLKNFESVSIIHSAPLAAQKIKRLESLPAAEQMLKDISANTEKTFALPLSLLTDPEIFPAALGGREIRTIALYLLLLAEAQSAGKNQFEIELETWGERLPARKRWIGRGLRQEMRRALDFLKGYGLIEWQGAGENKARVTLLPVKSVEQILVPEALIKDGYIKTLEAKELFAYLIVLRKGQVASSVPFWLGSIADVAKEFHLNPVTLIHALWELRRRNLIEIYPSEKKWVGGVWQREFTNRYRINPLESPGQRLSRFDGLNQKFGEDLVLKARWLADQLDDPEDTEVVRELVHLLKNYPIQDVANAVRNVAGFNRNNALRTPAYVRGILTSAGGRDRDVRAVDNGTSSSPRM